MNQVHIFNFFNYHIMKEFFVCSLINNHVIAEALNVTCEKLIKELVKQNNINLSELL